MVSSHPLSPPATRLSRRTKLAYGVGEVARAVIQNIRVVFLLYFLTHVAGLNAALAGTVLLIGRLWDGLNDPLVGWLSDRTQFRFGKRYPWMVAILPYFIQNWMQLPVQHVTQMVIAMQVTALASLPLWCWLSQGCVPQDDGRTPMS